MDASEILGYLSALLNRPLSEGTLVSLSSAQRARLGAWLNNHGVMFDSANLRGQVSVASLVIMGTNVQGASPIVPKPYIARNGRASAESENGLSIGIDIQLIEELFRGVDLDDFKADRQLAEIFTLRELSYAQSSKMPMETLAGIFAAKEAVRKCTGGAELSREEFRGIEILPDDDGKPRTSGFEISISHSGGFAVAVSCRGIVRDIEESVISGGSVCTENGRAAMSSEKRRMSIYERALWVGGVLLLVESAALIALLVFR